MPPIREQVCCAGRYDQVGIRWSSKAARGEAAKMEGCRLQVGGVTV